MKKEHYAYLIILTLFTLISGFFLGVDYATPPIKPCELCEKCDTIEANSVKLIHNMCIIFDRHDLYDIDGSDEMSELLEAQSNLAEIYNW